MLRLLCPLPHPTGTPDINQPQSGWTNDLISLRREATMEIDPFCDAESVNPAGIGFFAQRSRSGAFPDRRIVRERDDAERLGTVGWANIAAARGQPRSKT